MKNNKAKVTFFLQLSMFREEAKGMSIILVSSGLFERGIIAANKLSLK